MRISDWSSYVCSSDLIPGHCRSHVDSKLDLPVVDTDLAEMAHSDFRPFVALRDAPYGTPCWAMTAHIVYSAIDAGHPRSEEHTSELQSLIRISYAVFCLKKKKSGIKYTITNH